MTHREQIITAVLDALSKIDGVRTVSREHPAFEEVKGFAATQLPYVGVLAGLPVPQPESPHYRTGARGASGVAGPIMSHLSVSIFFVGMDYHTPDASISHFANEIWRLVHADRTLAKTCSRSWLSPESEPGIRHPYYAFFFDLTVEFFHDLSTI